MSENKTKPTQVAVSSFLDSIEGDQRRADCETLLGIMHKITVCPPVMWGPSIVGFDTYHYKYDSGREGDWAVTGFTPRKNDLSVHLMAIGPDQEGLLARLGRHKMGKSWLYIRKLSDIDLAVLEQLIIESVAGVKRLYG